MKDIKGMKITFNIMFDGDFDKEKRIQLMEQVEDEISDMIDNYKELIVVGGKGEWINKEINL